MVVGDRDHPEVSGILGYTEGKGAVVGDPGEVEIFPTPIGSWSWRRRPFAGTVFSPSSKRSRGRYPSAEVQVVDTLCDSTKRRQDEVKELAGRVDAMVVVGGRDSGNTRRLYETARSRAVCRRSR